MSERMPKIYENLSEQEQLEADYNLVGFFKLLMKIDQRIKKSSGANYAPQSGLSSDRLSLIETPTPNDSKQ